MLQSILLVEIFCEGCTLPLVLMLLGAWLLGWLFWWLFNRSSYMDKITGLEGEVRTWKDRANDLEAKLSAANYEKDKFEKELASVKAKKADVEMELRACKETVENLRSQQDKEDK